MHKLSDSWKQLLGIGVWIVFLWMVAVMAPLVFNYAPSFPYSEQLKETRLPNWIYSWANFDGVHYLTIADRGYEGTGLIQAFFPTYPLLLRLGGETTQGHIVVGIVISTLSLIGIVCMQRKVFSSESFSTRRVLFLLTLLWPTSFFFQAVYTESLFLLLVLLSFWSAAKGRWLWAGVFAAVASATRVVGVFLVPALVIEWAIQHKILLATGAENWKHWRKNGVTAVSSTVQKFVVTLRTDWRSLALCSIGGVGIGLYSWYLWKTFGDPLYFFHVQAEFGSGRQESLVLFPQVVWRYLKIFATYRTYDARFFSSVFEFVSAVVGLLALLKATVSLRASWVTYGWLAFLLPTPTGTFSSMPRYILVVFPIWLVLAQYLAKLPKGIQFLLFLLSTVGLVYTTMLFVQGYWVA